MRKLFFSAIIIVFAIATQAQSNTDEIALIQSSFGMDKQDIVKDFMKITEGENTVFWKIYDEYEAARKVIGKKRISNITWYAENYSKLSNEKATEIINSSFSTQDEFLKLQQKTFTKLSKALSPLRAAQFTMLETYIENTIRMEILDEIPLIGEFEIKKK
jgi:hypothetical protein